MQGYLYNQCHRITENIAEESYQKPVIVPQGRIVTKTAIPDIKQYYQKMAAAPEDQNLYRHQRKCITNTDLDSYDQRWTKIPQMKNRIVFLKFF